MTEKNIIKLGAVCLVAYVGVRITCNVARYIVKKIDEKKESEKEQKLYYENMERMKKYEDTKSLDDLMDVVVNM